METEKFENLTQYASPPPVTLENPDVASYNTWKNKCQISIRPKHGRTTIGNELTILNAHHTKGKKLQQGDVDD